MFASWQVRGNQRQQLASKLVDTSFWRVQNLSMRRITLLFLTYPKLLTRPPSPIKGQKRLNWSNMGLEDSMCQHYYRRLVSSTVDGCKTWNRHVCWQELVLSLCTIHQYFWLVGIELQIPFLSPCCQLIDIEFWSLFFSFYVFQFPLYYIILVSSVDTNLIVMEMFDEINWHVLRTE